MYYVVYGFLWLISCLPLWVLYRFSDLVYGMLFYVIRYRKPVVMANLKIAFPEKTEKERIRIAKKFYRNLTDTFLETIKLISASPAFMRKHFSGNFEVINEAAKTNHKLQLHIGHNFNWEWGNVILSLQCDIPLIGVYMPLENKIFERVFRKLRSRFGTILVRATKMSQDFMPYRDGPYVLGLAADQNPGAPEHAWWFNFFGRPTPFVKGAARGAVRNQAGIIFGFVNKTKRGYYHIEMKKMFDNAENHSEEEMTRAFVQFLEEVIRQYPDMWLWSHRRWKHSWKPEYGPVSS